MKRPVRVASCVLVLFLASAANAEPTTLPAPDPATLRGESVQTRKRLAEAEQKLLAGKPADAADDLQRIMDECPDDLITVDGQQFQTARWVAHSLLARLPPEALKAYQDRIDQPAKKLLDQAKRDRNPQPLWQLLDWYFVSRPADEALLLLGDLLFERGEFRTAETIWRRLLPNANADIVYPNSKAEPTLVRARIALAVIFQNDPARAKAEVAAFKEKYPTATGTLAGKTGPLANVLQTFLDAPPKLPPDATSGTIWPTYGGAPQRTSRVPGGIPPWPSRPTLIRNIIRPAAFAPTQPPLGYPAIINDEVFVANGTRVYGFDLRTSEPTRDEYTTFLKLEPNSAKPLEAQCTLTAAGELLYARLGPSVLRAPEQARSDSVLVCLSLRTQGKFTELWKLLPPEDGKAATTWEGAPLVSGRRLWAVYAKFEGGHIIHVAVCYDPADTDKPPGAPAWTTELCDSPQPAAGHDRTRQELLTLAGRNVVFCSNNGAIVAINATTGRRAWGFRYPRSRKVNLSGDPSPAVAYGGCVYVAPADGEHVYALDAETGRLVWQSDGETEGARILGVARNRLIVTVTGRLRSIRGLNLETGSHRKDEGGWVQNGNDLLSYGHGLVTDDVIVWPSRKGLYFLRPEDGRPAAGSPNPFRGPSIEMYFGHVAYANGTLVVVTPTQLWFYRAQSRKIETRPVTPPRERFDTMIGLAERNLTAGHSDRANAILAEIATSDLPPEFRAWAAARMLQLAPPAKELSQLSPKVREVLIPTLLNEWILPPDGVPVTLDTFLQKRLGRSPAPASVPVVATQCKPVASELTADAEIDRTLKLPEAVVPLRPIVGSCPPKRLFAAGPRVVVAVPLDRSAETEHTAADLFTHAADLQTCFVTAGPFAIAVYGMAREPLWVFRVPRTEPLPSSSPTYRVCSDGEPPCPHLSSFVLAGTWMLARIGEHHLIALDLQARRVAWVLGTSGNARYEPNHFPGEVKFGSHYAICGHFVVVQLSNGRRWFVALATGRPVTMPTLGDRTARNGWPHAPAIVGDDQLIVADGPGLVRLLQLGGRVKWAFEPESDEGFTGEPAQVRACGPGLLRREPSPQILLPPSLLLIAVRRNHGVEIERVNIADGKSAWSNGPAFVDADHIDLRAAVVDAERVYIPAGNKLLALMLTSGKTAWEVDLPDARCSRGWVVRAGKTCVIAYPAEAIPTEPILAVWARLVRSFQREPFAWRLPGLAGTLYDAWSDRAVPVLFFDPETGKRLARINIPARGPAITAWFDADTAVIATGDRVVWLK